MTLLYLVRYSVGVGIPHAFLMFLAAEIATGRHCEYTSLFPLDHLHRYRIVCILLVTISQVYMTGAEGCGYWGHSQSMNTPCTHIQSKTRHMRRAQQILHHRLLRSSSRNNGPYPTCKVPMINSKWRLQGSGKVQCFMTMTLVSSRWWAAKDDQVQCL